MACPECRGKHRHALTCRLLNEQLQEIVDRARSSNIQMLARTDPAGVFSTEHSGGHCLCSLELLEAQERLAAALKVVSAARAWREAETGRPEHEATVALVESVEAWETGA